MSEEPKNDLIATVRTDVRATGGAQRVLVILHGDQYVHHPLPATGEVTIGRASWCTIRIDDPSLSRNHAALCLGARIAVKDLGSANGTTLRGAQLPAEVEVEIAPNEMFVAGAVAMVVQERRVGVRRPAGSIAAPAPSGGPDIGDAAPVLRDPAMMHLYELARRVAAGTISVLVVGETGAGKEVLAEHIHKSSPRASGPYLRINCAALTDSLFESELFGHERGAFTGAMQAKKGLLEAADGGTVFLDEIGELSRPVQSKLLRVLEEGHLLRVGGVTPRPIDVRFVAATNRDLDSEIASGGFRQDLFYRLAGVVLEIPPLRERRGEIAALARRFVEDACARLGRDGRPELSAAAVAVLEAHDWPGNIRELRNAIERAVLLWHEGAIEPEHLPLATSRPAAGDGAPSASGSSVAIAAQGASAAAASAALPPAETGRGALSNELAALERQRIIDALDKCGGNQSRAAELLGMPRRTLVKRLTQYDIPRPRRG